MDPSLAHELTAAYALNALDEDERRSYEEHLRTCEQCRRELRRLQEASGALAYGARSATPRPELRDQLLAQAAAERARATVVPLRRRMVIPALGAVTAAAVAAAAALAIWTVSLSDSLDDERAARADTSALLALAASPDATRVRLDGAAGTLVVAPDGDAALFVTGLPEAPEGTAYAVWIVAGEPRLAGTLGGGAATAVHLSQRVPPAATVAVTLEPDEDIVVPTSDPLFSATVS